MRVASQTQSSNQAGDASCKQTEEELLLTGDPDLKQKDRRASETSMDRPRAGSLPPKSVPRDFQETAAAAGIKAVLNDCALSEVHRIEVEKALPSLVLHAKESNDIMKVYGSEVTYGAGAAPVVAIMTDETASDVLALRVENKLYCTELTRPPKSDVQIAADEVRRMEQVLEETRSRKELIEIVIAELQLTIKTESVESYLSKKAPKGPLQKITDAEKLQVKDKIKELEAHGPSSETIVGLIAAFPQIKRGNLDYYLQRYRSAGVAKSERGN